MFLAPDGKSYEPHRIRSRKKEVVSNGDVTMDGTGEANGDEEEFFEDPDDDEGAIYPLKGTEQHCETAERLELT